MDSALKQKISETDADLKLKSIRAKQKENDQKDATNSSGLVKFWTWVQLRYHGMTLNSIIVPKNSLIRLH